MRTGFPIVYTSGDSVFQIAAHEDVIPIAELYRMCEIARKLLDGPQPRGASDCAAVYRARREISGAPSGGTITPWSRRGRCCWTCWRSAACLCSAWGKFTTFTMGAGWGTTSPRRTTLTAWRNLPKRLLGAPSGLIFANLVDFDMLYGHRKDVEGFARSLEEFDALLGPFLAELRPSDLLIITADHGCDPDPVNPTTDHSREYVPIVAYTPRVAHGVNLGIRSTLADMGQTIAENFGGAIPHGTSFLGEVAGG